MAKKANHGLRFTGGDHLTPKDGFKYYLHQAMMVNELHGGMVHMKCLMLYMVLVVQALVEFNLMWDLIKMAKSY